MFARVSRLSASIPLWFVAVAFPLALAFLPREAVAQDPCTQFWPPPPPECYGVSVTPKGGVTATRLANTGGYSETFYVSNTGLGDTYAIGCYGTGGVTCTGTSLSELNPGVNTPVTAYYSVGSPGTGTLTLTATGSNASDGGWVTVPIQSFGVTVTPDGGSEPTRVPNTSGYSAAFTVLNTGSGSETYVLTCTSSGNVTCGTVGPGTAQLGANVSKQVIVSYVVGNAGTGTLKLRASSAYSNDSAWYSIPIGQAAGAPIVDLAPYTFDKQDY